MLQSEFLIIIVNVGIVFIVRISPMVIILTSIITVTIATIVKTAIDMTYLKAHSGVG